VISDETKEVLRRHLELRDERDAAKKEAERLEKEYRESEADLYEMIDESGIKGGIKVDLGAPWGEVSFSNRSTTFGRIIKGMEDDAFEYFSQRAMLDEVTSPKFSMKRIHEIVRDCEEQGVDMPKGIDYYKRRGVTITRQKD
jgi:hypothetical protein